MQESGAAATSEAPPRILLAGPARTDRNRPCPGSSLPRRGIDVRRKAYRAGARFWIRSRERTREATGAQEPTRLSTNARHMYQRSTARMTTTYRHPPELAYAREIMSGTVALPL
jgi:hypothetical protein